MAQFSDLPLQLSPEEESQYHPFCHARHVSEYLEKYVRVHVYNNESLHDRILFGTRVNSITRVSCGWEVSCQIMSRGPGSMDVEGESEGSVLRTKILLECTGLASKPYIPPIPGMDNFKGLMIHQKDLGRHEETILSTAYSSHSAYTAKKKPKPGKKHIVVVGGAKSAADTVYACAKSVAAENISVKWIIRESGSGPAAFLPSKGAERFYTRVVSAFLPCAFNQITFCESLIHRTRLGMWVLKRLWGRVDRRYRADANFGREDGVENGFSALECDTPVFWQNDSSGINQKADFWDTIAKHVRMYRRDVASIGQRSLVLRPRAASKEDVDLTIPVDILIYCTGWASAPSSFDGVTASQLGLPTSKDLEDPNWQKLDIKADSSIISRFPMLANPPPVRMVSPPQTPYRLYKAIAPPSDSSDRSILFLGRVLVGNNFLGAEAQALWAVAYLDGRIDSTESAMKQEIAQTVAWSKLRYLSKGQQGIWCYFDIVAYADMLLRQVGLKSHRSQWWLGDNLVPVHASCCKGLVDEYKARFPG